MADTPIEPVSVTTVGGFPATIKGFDSTDHDVLYGTIVAPDDIYHVRWNAAGICRGGTEDCNLRPKDEKVLAVLEIAKGSEPTLEDTVRQ